MLSGAYAVLEGAPAIVTAVDRYVVADSARAAEFEAPEVRAALGDRPLPWFDASALRDGGQKLGLGSSAAILVASLAAVKLDEGVATDHDALLGAVFRTAIEAHHRAQGGGSGIDVAAAAHGGTILARRRGAAVDVESVPLPGNLHVEIWAAGRAASTPEFLARVRALGDRDATAHRRLLDRLGQAALRAAAAVKDSDARALVDALGEQSGGLDELGRAAHIPIVTDEVRELNAMAKESGAVFMPAGAGGGDVAFFAGLGPPSPAFARRGEELGQRRLKVSVEASGVSAA